MAESCPQCEELREENAYLRGELALDVKERDILRLREVFKLTDQPARLLLIMRGRKTRPITTAIADDLLPGERSYPKFLSVTVHRLRAALGADAIEGIWGQGYRLINPAGLAKVSEALA